MVHVVKTKTPLDAQAALIGRAFAAQHADDSVVLDLIAQQAADAAERADGIDGTRRHGLPRGIRHCEERRRRGNRNDGGDRHLDAQCAGGAGLHALAAGHAGAGTHGVAQVEHDLAVGATPGVANHVVHL